MLPLDVTRRDFLKSGVGVASFAVTSGLLALAPARTAKAVAGIDDVTLGGLVLLVATLGGYAFSRSVANSTLSAMGYGFSDFVSDASNQAAAVTKTLADANNLGVELNRSNAEQAAASIAAGTGYFAEVMGDAATSGRVALDNFISGAGELPGVLRNLVGDFISTKLSSDGANVLGNAVGSDLVSNDLSFSQFTETNRGSVLAKNIDDIAESHNIDIGDATWMIQAFCYNGNSFAGGSIMWGNVPVSINVTYGGRWIIVDTGSSSLKFSALYVYASGNHGNVITQKSREEGVKSTSASVKVNYVFSGSLVSGGTLPVVDRAVDVPDVIGPGYDSLPLGNDLVIDPSTDDVVSAGSLPLPTSIPDVFGDFVGTLNDALAGVVPGVIGLPVSVSEPVVVGTAEGVASMPISEAVATETSLAASLDPPAPTPPPGTVDPPVTVPEGPWTPAVALPFEQLWPFNMIYTLLQVFEQLGG